MIDPWERFRAELTEAWNSEGDGRRLVFGKGVAFRPRLCLIGEAPGAQEEAQGEPFVGKAGENLNAFLRAIGLRREALYITNVVKVRPSRMGPSGRLSNRPPNQGEKRFFIPWLMRELQLCEPVIVVTLGNTALQAVAGRDARIGDCHGVPQAAARPGAPAFRLFPLYHPAAIIYDRALTAVYEADLLTLRGVLERDADVN